MSTGAGPLASLPLEQAARVDRACDAFEAALRAGAAPRIEDDLARADESDRPALLVQLLASELEWRFGRGERPAPAEYLARFPGRDDAVWAAFEEAGPRGDSSPTLLARRPADPGPELRRIEFAAPAWPARVLPGYEVLGELGRGGMGVVYKARHLRLNRVVAVKTLRADPSPEAIARLLAEAEAVARLQHPQIVQVHGVGEYDGHPYFEMEYVTGGSLAERLDGKPRPPREAAALVASLARAIHEAHRLGVVHRDLKPANVLLTEDGTPKITDFGLAKLVDSADGAALTRSGAVLGTPGYMAPEQADGGTRAIGPAADIHALGVLLYELLTGRRPFPGPSMAEVLDQVRNHEPTPPRTLVRSLPRDLETICLKCLEKAPDRRYADARTLADDLHRFLQGDSIAARPVGLLGHLARALSRRQDDRAFNTWAPIILFVATPALFLSHLAVFLLAREESPYLQAGTFLPVAVVVALVFAINRARTRAPSDPSLALLSALARGQVAAIVANGAVVMLLVGPSAPGGILPSYPLGTVALGTMFFTMGATHWGRLYLAGLAHFALAPIMAANLTWAPLELAVLLSLTCIAVGLHVRRA